MPVSPLRHCHKALVPKASSCFPGLRSHAKGRFPLAPGADPEGFGSLYIPFRAQEIATVGEKHPSFSVLKQNLVRLSSTAGQEAAASPPCAGCTRCPPRSALQPLRAASAPVPTRSQPLCPAKFLSQTSATWLSSTIAQADQQSSVIGSKCHTWLCGISQAAPLTGWLSLPLSALPVFPVTACDPLPTEGIISFAPSGPQQSRWQHEAEHRSVPASQISAGMSGQHAGFSIYIGFLHT